MLVELEQMLVAATEEESLLNRGAKDQDADEEEEAEEEEAEEAEEIEEEGVKEEMIVATALLGGSSRCVCEVGGGQ